jgi:hypothetical protein
MAVAVHEVVPEQVPLPPRLFVQVTLVTAVSSEAVPPTVTLSSRVAKDGLEVGSVIATVGDAVSAAAGLATLVRCERVATELFGAACADGNSTNATRAAAMAARVDIGDLPLYSMLWRLCYGAGRVKTQSLYARIQ